MATAIHYGMTMELEGKEGAMALEMPFQAGGRHSLYSGGRPGHCVLGPFSRPFLSQGRKDI